MNMRRTIAVIAFIEGKSRRRLQSIYFELFINFHRRIFIDSYTFNIVPPNPPFVKDYFYMEVFLEKRLPKHKKGNIII